MEFNSGKPPAGEVGMVVAIFADEERELYSYWSGEYRSRNFDFAVSWRAHKHPAACDDSDRWRWATFAEVSAEVGPEEAAKMVHKSMLADAPFCSPQPVGYGPWIKHKVGEECPIPGVECIIQITGGSSWDTDEPEAYYWSQAPYGTCVVAYCLKLEAKPAIAATCAPPDGAWRDWQEGDTVPSVDRVDVIRTEAGAKGSTLKQIDNVVTTSQYWGPSSFVRKWRPAVARPVIADPNSKMFDRDADGVVSCVRERHNIDWPSFDHAAIVAAGRDYAKRQHDKRVAAAAWVERPRDHRLGNFN